MRRWPRWPARCCVTGRPRWAVRADVFDAAFAGAPATLIKIVHYPATAASSQGVGAHRDSGVLTLLFAEPGSRGLQVRVGRDGDWIDVPARDGAFIVNIGELLQLATGGYLRPPSTG